MQIQPVCLLPKQFTLSEYLRIFVSLRFGSLVFQLFDEALSGRFSLILLPTPNLLAYSKNLWLPLLGFPCKYRIFDPMVQGGSSALPEKTVAVGLRSIFASFPNLARVLCTT